MQAAVDKAPLKKQAKLALRSIEAAKAQALTSVKPLAKHALFRKS